MKTILNNKAWKAILILLFATMNLMCAQKHTSSTIDKDKSENGDKTGSPYFVITSDNNETLEGLPLESTKANVVIAGVIADVTVTQVYRNRGKSPIEAMYVFPASTRAAVYAMKMQIGERTIIAKIEEKEKARQDYIDAKQQGKSASLLEQQRPNVFTMNVANLMPGDLINVTLQYTELLVPEEGVYEFVYPTVVGPRYSNGTETPSGTEPWVGNPYTRQGVAPAYVFGLNIRINAGLPLNDVRCKSHKVDIKYSSQSEAFITLDESEKNGGNKDYILQYRLQGNAVNSGLLLYKGEHENFFLAMIQPPKSVSIDQIPPREYVFIVDVSGSMYGFPLDISKKLMKNIISNLRITDRFNVILFAGGSQIMHPESLPATKENITSAISWIDKQQGGGGTELLPALKAAMAMKTPEGFSRSFVIATDGYVSIEKEAFDFIRKNLNRANFFSFGIGSSVNRHLIEGMAHVGQGLPFIIEKSEVAEASAIRFRKYIEQPVLTNITVQYNGFETYDVEPLSVPDVLSERPVIIFGKWKGNAAGTITLKGKSGKGDYQQTLKVSDFKVSQENTALKYLWARERIKILDDYSAAGADPDRTKMTTELGLKYNLLTNYTSFIAIDSEVRNKDGKSTTVRQTLPLPDGVSNYAVASPYVNGYTGGGNTKSSGVKRCNTQELDFGTPVADARVESLVIMEDPKDQKESSDTLESYLLDKDAAFRQGKEAFEKFIQKNIQYPEEAKKSKVSGKVHVSFVVDENGKLLNVHVVSGVYPSLDKEAIRVIKLTSGMWSAGELKGKKVKSRVTVPVEFKLI